VERHESVPTHWTYSEIGEDADLFQGDIIGRHPSLLGVLERVHGHFCDSKYLAYVVITQTCDLVVRKARQCKAKHINLAVVRSLEDLVPTIFPRSLIADMPAVYREEARGETEELLERLVNQNEQAHGMFYLHPDADVEIAVPAVCLLRISIALKSVEHYGLLKVARRGRLSTEYRNKLGWLTGNLYSRVDTKDWADHPGGEDDVKSLISGFIEGTSLAQRNVWVRDAWINAARKRRVRIEDIPRGSLFEELRKYEPLPPLETVKNKVREFGSKVLSQFGDEELDDFQVRLRKNPLYASFVLERVVVIALEIFGEAGLKLFASLRQDEDFLQSLPEAIAVVIAEFKKRRGPRDLAVFLTSMANAPLLQEASISRIREFISAGEGVQKEITGEFEERLRSERPSACVIEFMKGLACDVITETAIDRLIRRLESDAAIRAALA
jgi:hypothetical protein